MPKRLTKEEFAEKSNKIHNGKYNYSKVEYVNNRTKVCIICPEHGEFWQIPDYHLSGCGCPKCGLKTISKKSKKTKDDFLEKTKKVHGDKYDYSKVEYVNNRTKVCIICPEHGEFWQTPHNHENGQGCPICGKINGHRKQKLTKNVFIEKARKIHGDKYDYSKVEYVNNHTKVCIICQKHGEFWIKPNAHLNGHGCPKCSSSVLEEEIAKFLDKNNIQYIREKKFDWLINVKELRLDFFLPEYNAMIECQGIQHFQPTDFGGMTSEELKKEYADTIERDKIKNKLCVEHGIKPYYYSKIKKKYQYFLFHNKEKMLKEIQNGK